jgi:hypothetical protein
MTPQSGALLPQLPVVLACGLVPALRMIVAGHSLIRSQSALTADRELNIYITFLDAVLARVLIAAGQPEAAHERLDTALALAQETGMCFYDAELLRLLAHTHDDPAARRADITAALTLAHRQGATLFELRAALDGVELRGQPMRAALVDSASRIPTDNAWPELARAHRILG